jgi:hypothetical protein
MNKLIKTGLYVSLSIILLSSCAKDAPTPQTTIVNNGVQPTEYFYQTSFNQNQNVISFDLKTLNNKYNSDASKYYESFVYMETLQGFVLMPFTNKNINYTSAINNAGMCTIMAMDQNGFNPFTTTQTVKLKIVMFEFNK